ncbi:acyl-CoA thioesterase [Mobilicoccus caccae]|uniref:Thioesterase n=1 Tax=Mobilicoccus caccae TaxID=1859295 RepID=A0ABQ6IMC7_9MICO|nr:thioesterase family protein [Mobilicoccus caccae]GMA39080.1 thioesterase [Mobilicoccus caccae]
MSTVEPYACEVQVRWSDQDINGHVNNARLVTLVEEVRVRALKAWGLPAPGPHRPRVLRSFEVSFDRAVHYGPELTGRAWISRIGVTSFTVGHELLQQGHRCVRLHAVMVLLDPDTHRPLALEPSYRAILERYLIPRESD